MLLERHLPFSAFVLFKVKEVITTQFFFSFCFSLFFLFLFLSSFCCFLLCVFKPPKMVAIPKQMKTFCPGSKCKKHTLHKVSQYKKGKDSVSAQGL